MSLKRKKNLANPSKSSKLKLLSQTRNPRNPTSGSTNKFNFQPNIER
jgi:hypothetical protein